VKRGNHPHPISIVLFGKSNHFKLLNHRSEKKTHWYNPCFGLIAVYILIGGNMISVRIHLVASKGKQRELRQAVETISQKIVMEDGCLGCQIFQSTSDEHELVLIGEWETLENAWAHVASGNMAVLVGAGTILADSIRVYPERDLDIQVLKNIYEKRFSPKLRMEQKED
jgi:quinol monooxygenase YgiN